MGHEFAPGSGVSVSIEDRNAGLVTRWVTVVEVIDADGTEGLHIKRSPGLADWDVIGMLGFVMDQV